MESNVSSSWDYTHPEQLVEIMMPESFSPTNRLSSGLKVLFNILLWQCKLLNYFPIVFKYIAENVRQIMLLVVTNSFHFDKNDMNSNSFRFTNNFTFIDITIFKSYLF